MISLPKSKGSDYTTRPTGDLVIPSTVTHDGVTYNVTSIGEGAFYGCTGMTSITTYAELPPTLGDNVFNEVPSNINVYVPCGNINAEIYQRNGQVVVDGAEGNTVSFYDITGRILATKQDYGTPLRFDAPVSGTYMIKIGNYQARKVVVIR